MIFILNKQEKIINLLKNNGSNSNASPFFNDLLTEDLSTGTETFSFSTLADGTLMSDLIVGNYVAFKKNNRYRLFQILQVETIHGEDIEIVVYSESVSLSLINNVFRGVTSNSITVKRFVEMVLQGTEWKVGFVDDTLVNSLDLQIEDGSVYSVLQNNIQKFGGEIEFSVNINNDRISQKTVNVYASRGRVTGKRFTFGRDIEGITRKVDSTNLCTALIGKGKDGIDFRDIQVEGINKPIGQDFVSDDVAFQSYNRNGQHLIGIFEYETDSPHELLIKTNEHLKKVCKPKITYEIPVVLLGELLGNSWDTIRIGDTVGILDSEFTPQLRLLARVSKLETSFTNPQDDKCTLSNFVEISSNISDEMRKIASKLQGYVEAKFPVGSNDIQDGAVGKNQLDNQYLSELKVDIIQASKIEAESIVTDTLSAINAKFETVIADYIEADEIMAQNIKTDYLEADKIVVDRIEGVEGNFSTLNATVGNIETLVAGNITSENIQSGGISSDRLTVSDGFIKDVMIQSVTAGKITSGEIDTNNVSIGNDKISIADSTMQFKDDSGNVRIQMGEDTAGDFNFILRGADGTTTLIDQNGVQDKALADGLIKDRMIGNGEIGGEKININSMVTAINNGTSVIKSSKVQLDTLGQTLDIAFNTLKTNVDGIQVGGRNLFEHSNYPTRTHGEHLPISSWGGNMATASFDNDVPNGLVGFSEKRVTEVSGVGGNYHDHGSFILELGQTYTVSFYAKATKNITVNGYLCCLNRGTDNHYITHPSLDLSTSYKKYSYTFKVSEGEEGVYTRRSIIYVVSTIYLSHFKLEKGNKATDWTPAPEDIDGAINNVKEITEANTTQIGIEAGKINTLIQNTTIVKDGQTVQLKDEYNRTVATVDAISNTIGQHKTLIDANTGNITNVDTKVNTVQRDLESAKSTISSNSSSISDLNGSIVTTNNKIDNIQVGGRNLQTRSRLDYIPSNFGEGLLELVNDEEHGKVLHLGRHVFLQPISKSKYNIGDVVTTSFFVKATAGTKLPFQMHDGDSVAGYHGIEILPEEANKWVVKSLTSVVTHKGVTDAALYLYYENNPIFIKWVKVEKGNKATDWTPAPEDIDGAIVEVNGKVTTVENKQSSLEQDVNGFKQTVSNTYSTKAELSSVDGKVNSVTTRIGNAESAINQNTESIKLTATKTEVESAVNNIQVGGRNLRVNSSLFTGNANNTGLGSSAQGEDSTGKFIRITPNPGCHVSQFLFDGLFSEKFKVGKTYSLSVDFRTNEPAEVEFYVRNGSNTTAISSVIIKNTEANKWTRINITDLVIDAQSENTILYIYGCRTPNVVLDTRRLKVEIGNKATDWSPAPEDINASINAVDSKVETVKSQVAEIKIETDSITQRVSNTESVTSTLTTQIGQVDGKIQTAKNEAISSASTDATNKANTAQTNAINSSKGYTDGQITTVNSTITTTNNKVTSLETNLNGITQRVSSTETNVSNIQTDTANIWSGNYEVNTTTILPLKLKDKTTDFNVGNWYEVSAKTLGTGTATGASAIFKGNGTGFVLDIVSEKGTTSNHPQFYLNNGVPSIKLYSHTSTHTVNVSIKEVPRDTSVLSTVKDTTSKVATIETNVNSITSRVSSVESTQSSQNGNITNLQGRMNTAEQKITPDAIVSTVTSSQSWSNAFSINEQTKASGIEILDTSYRYNLNMKPFVTTGYTVVPAETVAGGVVGSANVLKITDGKILYTGWIPVDPKNPFYATMELFDETTTNGSVYMQGAFADENKVGIGSTFTMVGAQRVNTPNTWVKFEGWSSPITDTDILSKAKYVRFRIINRYNALLGVTYAKNISFKQLGANALLTDTISRVSTTEQKLTSDGIVSTISQAMADGKVIDTVSTVLDKNGFTVNNGSLTVKNKAGQVVLRGDTDGNLALGGSGTSGALKVYNSSNVQIGTIDKDGILVDTGKLQALSSSYESGQGQTKDRTILDGGAIRLRWENDQGVSSESKIGTYRGRNILLTPQDVTEQNGSLWISDNSLSLGYIEFMSWGAGKRSIRANDPNDSISLKSHANNTWFRNQTTKWVFQGGSGGDDWTNTFSIEGFSPAVNNGGWVRIGQSNSNATNGVYGGVNIVRYDNGRVVDGNIKFDNAVANYINSYKARGGNAGSWWWSMAAIGSDGVMEGGKYLDFHNNNGDSADYNVRLECFGTNLACTGVFTHASDKRVKKEIVYVDSVAKLTSRENNSFRNFIKDKLKVATFKYKQQSDKENSNIGFIAQDIFDSDVAKSFVFEREVEDIKKLPNGTTKVIGSHTELNYSLSGYTTVVAKALQEEISFRDAEIAELKERIASLERVLNNKIKELK